MTCRGGGALLWLHMRIIAGKYRSRKLVSPKDSATTRPIPDRVKESLFSILRGNVEGAQVLDCFAGTGSIGLEALSRGASRVVCVERDKRAADILEKNIVLLGAEDECEVVRGDALGPAALARAPKPVDLAFFDPPYPLVLDPERWPHVVRQFARVVELLSDGGFALLRTPWPFRHIETIDGNGQLIPFGDDRNPFDIYGNIRKDLPPPSGKKRKGEHRRVHDSNEGDDQSWEMDEIDLAQIEADTRDREQLDLIAEMGPTRGLKITRQDVDLHIPGAVGPETHEYASMAVHIYMRKK